MLGVQQRLGVACTGTMPAVHALLHEIELAPVVVVPGTVNLVAGLSHHIDAQIPVLIAYAKGNAVAHVGGRVTNHGAVGGGDFTITVYIHEF